MGTPAETQRNMLGYTQPESHEPFLRNLQSSETLPRPGLRTWDNGADWRKKSISTLSFTEDVLRQATSHTRWLDSSALGRSIPESTRQLRGDSAMERADPTPVKQELDHGVNLPEGESGGTSPVYNVHGTNSSLDPVDSVATLLLRIQRALLQQRPFSTDGSVIKLAKDLPDNMFRCCPWLKTENLVLLPLCQTANGYLFLEVTTKPKKPHLTIRVLFYDEESYGIVMLAFYLDEGLTSWVTNDTSNWAFLDVESGARRVMMWTQL